MRESCSEVVEPAGEVTYRQRGAFSINDDDNNDNAIFRLECMTANA